MRPIARIAPDVGWLPISFVNVYFVGRPGSAWVLVDSGLPGGASQILAAAEARFGSGSRPEAIYLTHGHFDHAGSAMKLAEAWDVPIYAHRLDLPYLTGRSSYPPPDPTIGGAIAFLSRFMPSRAFDLNGRVRELPPGELPGMNGWERLATPGHSPGHISFFRSSDRVLLAGDAFATMNMDSWSGLISAKRTLACGGSPFNMDWEATRLSVMQLAKLRPNVVGCGHGIPLHDSDLADRLEKFAGRFHSPRRGRYVAEPARTDESGVISLPPAPFDPVPFATAAGLIAAGIMLGTGYLANDHRRERS
jgi:glyoxylase-like metal-dependent hydrolase (beta-lactamase superfamily II)